MIRKVVIAAAGLGTRLLPATKEQPKEMLPVFAPGSNEWEGSKPLLKPLLQLVLEQLCDVGLTHFCFVIGRGKRAIEDHFTQDESFLATLRNRGKDDLALVLEGFYERLQGSKIVWVNQPEPKGFGDAVLKARPCVGDEDFLVVAGDSYVISRGNAHLKRLMKSFYEFEADALLVTQKIEDPRQHGIIEFEELGDGVLKVKRAIEKPEEPTSNMAILPFYAFRPVIFEALEKTRLGKGGEMQLTDGIQTLIDWGLKVYAIQLNSDEVRLDIGNPQTYWEALILSHEHATGNKAQF